MRNGSTVQVVTLLLSLVAALAGLWNGWQLARLTGQAQDFSVDLKASDARPTR